MVVKSIIWIGAGIAISLMTMLTAVTALSFMRDVPIKTGTKRVKRKKQL